jgi:hypothetical protein
MDAELYERLAARKRALIPQGWTEAEYDSYMVMRANALARKTKIEANIQAAKQAKIQAAKQASAASAAPAVTQDVLLTDLLATYGAQLSDDEVLLAKYVSPLNAGLDQRIKRVLLIRERAKAAKLPISNIIQMFMQSKDQNVLDLLKISAQEWME